MFLDEVGDMPLATQIKLLRVLESGEITRVGSNEPIQVNVRMLSATNRNLEDAIAAGRFRSDLYHRLKVVTIRLPALRERSQDIPILIDYFLKQFAAQHGKPIKGMSVGRPAPAAELRLAGQRPPAPQRDREHGGGRLRRAVGRGRPARGVGRPAGEPAGEPSRPHPGAWWAKPLEEIERLFIAETLRVTGGNREVAASQLGIGQRTLYRKIKEYGL